MKKFKDDWFFNFMEKAFPFFFIGIFVFIVMIIVGQVYFAYEGLELIETHGLKAIAEQVWNGPTKP